MRLQQNVAVDGFAKRVITTAVRASAPRGPGVGSRHACPRHRNGFVPDNAPATADEGRRGCRMFGGAKGSCRMYGADRLQNRDNCAESVHFRRRHFAQLLTRYPLSCKSRANLTRSAYRRRWMPPSPARYACPLHRIAVEERDFNRLNARRASRGPTRDRNHHHVGRLAARSIFRAERQCRLHQLREARRRAARQIAGRASPIAALKLKRPVNMTASAPASASPETPHQSSADRAVGT